MICEAIQNLERASPSSFCSVDQSTQIICSDYSGQHAGAKYEAFSFVVTTEDSLQRWLPELTQFRKNFLPDGRRLSYKKLREPIRQKALPHYLECMGNLEGNLICIMLNKELVELFPKSVQADFSDCFAPNTKNSSIEKIFKLASFVALITVCLRREEQPSFWISDHDEALDSHERREGFARLASYLSFGLARWKNPADNLFTTTELPNLPFWGEDVTALADLTAGVYCTLNEILPKFFETPNWTLRMSPPDIVDVRGRTIINWMATAKNKMKHVLVRVEPDGASSYRASAQAFQSPLNGRK
jgi:hypothetical protein